MEIQREFKHGEIETDSSQEAKRANQTQCIERETFEPSSQNLQKSLELTPSWGKSKCDCFDFDVWLDRFSEIANLARRSHLKSYCHWDSLSVQFLGVTCSLVDKAEVVIPTQDKPIKPLCPMSGHPKPVHNSWLHPLM